MKQLVVTVDIGFMETGINLGDAIAAIQKSLEPIKLRAYETDDMECIAHSGEIVDEINDDELLGEWEIRERPNRV